MNADMENNDVPEKQETLEQSDNYKRSEEPLNFTEPDLQTYTDSEPCPPPASDNDNKKPDSSMELYDWVQCVVSALVAGILIFLFVGRIVNVDGRSMYPTLHDGDRIITTNLFYTPKQGDVVVVQTNTYGSNALVKRVIATEGQTVSIDFEAGIVYVDGVAQDEPYVNAPTHRQLDFEGEVTVPEGCMFLMGDNRNESTDSRSNMIGMVDTRCVIGKVVFILIPRGEDGTGFDASRIGTV